MLVYKNTHTEQFMYNYLKIIPTNILGVRTTHIDFFKCSYYSREYIND